MTDQPLKTGAERAKARLLTIADWQAVFYSNLPRPKLSRQAKRSVERGILRRAMRQAKKEQIKNRRKGKSS
jgi:hypothetical protein